MFASAFISVLLIFLVFSLLSLLFFCICLFHFFLIHLFIFPAFFLFPAFPSFFHVYHLLSQFFSFFRHLFLVRFLSSFILLSTSSSCYFPLFSFHLTIFLPGLFHLFFISPVPRLSSQSSLITFCYSLKPEKA